MPAVHAAGGLARRPQPEGEAARPACKGVRHCPCMTVRRIMPYHESADFEATRAFYSGVLGLEEGGFGGGYIGFGSGQAQVLFAAPGTAPVLPDMGVDVGSREAVDAAHAEVVRAGHEVVYGPVDEPWGVRRFFVRDPNGVVLSVLAHD
jgi:predicted enzyme related to lactoylglutathione lyase